MRYYDITLSRPNGGAMVRRWTSHVNGTNLAGALNVEMDIPVAPYATPMGAALVRIWGISLQDIAQASDLNNLTAQVRGGFQKGLPLANPAQAGLLVQGQVFQAFGNWIGTEMTLDLILTPGTGTPAAPKNIVLNWKAGTPLGAALETTLATALPDLKRQINISPNLVRSTDEPSYYQSLTELAQYLKEVSRATVNSQGYRGVEVSIAGDTIVVSDGSVASTSQPIAISFQDLIGQPTWIESPSIQLKCAMRADLTVGRQVTLPNTAVTNTAQALSLFRNKSVFQGKFQVQSIRHVGNLRQPDAASWVSVIDAFPVTQ